MKPSKRIVMIVTGIWAILLLAGVAWMISQGPSMEKGLAFGLAGCVAGFILVAVVMLLNRKSREFLGMLMGVFRR